jgi:hypothetical protein
MAYSKHLVRGYAALEAVVGLATIGGLVFAAGGVMILSIVQGANQLSFAQLMALGAVLGGMPTAVTLWVIRVLYDLRAKVAKLDGTSERLRQLEERFDEHIIHHRTEGIAK